MSITGGFGTTTDLKSGVTRRWFIGRDGVKRWADNGAPCEPNCDRSACGDYSPGDCDHPDCPARGRQVGMMDLLLLPCPFCGNDLARHENRANPYAKCETVGCKGAQLPVLRIDDSRDVAAWNTRTLNEEPYKWPNP